MSAFHNLKSVVESGELTPEQLKIVEQALKRVRYQKAYNARPEVKARNAEYHKEYNKRPQVKAKKAAVRKAIAAAIKEYGL